MLHGSDQAALSSQSDGGQEVPGNDEEQRGDADGRAVWWLRPGGSSITGVAGVAPACSPTPPRSCA
ncbi:hypothetical protein [Nonomuraea sp. NPDC050202]|uniref:hypothetical protein n=1 Tax=Nonomuraea sp. NPDC050202 TaxID=3155035 RepID=UPI00340F5B1A